MSDPAVDGVKVEAGNKIPIFLVNPEKSDINSIPIDKEECFYRLGGTFYRKALFVSQADPKDNGIRYIPILESLTLNFPENRIRTIVDSEKENA